MRTVYIPPFLEDTRTGDVVPFHVDIAKNPHMSPRWDAPEWLMAAADKQGVAIDTLMARAMTAVEKLPLTAGVIDGINESRGRLALEQGLVGVRLIGDSPDAKPPRKGRNDEALLRVAAQHVDVLRGQLPSGDVDIVSQAASGYSKDRVSAAAAARIGGDVGGGVNGRVPAAAAARIGGDAGIEDTSGRVRVVQPQKAMPATMKRVPLAREVRDSGADNLGA